MRIKYKSLNGSVIGKRDYMCPKLHFMTVLQTQLVLNFFINCESTLRCLFLLNCSHKEKILEYFII